MKRIANSRYDMETRQTRGVEDARDVESKKRNKLTDFLHAITHLTSDRTVLLPVNPLETLYSPLVISLCSSINPFSHKRSFKIGSSFRHCSQREGSFDNAGYADENG